MNMILKLIQYGTMDPILKHYKL